jgi:lactate dehydrogenase-like 2-hydroxyacid dehydrogenase
MCAFFAVLFPLPCFYRLTAALDSSTIGEHVLGTVIMLYHKLHTLNYLLRSEQRWVKAQTEFGGNYIRELNTLKVGILAYGHIGMSCSRRFLSFPAQRN